MRTAHVLAMSFLRNPAWYLKRIIALIDRCLNGVIYGRQRGREDIKKEKRLTTFQQPPMESLVSKKKKQMMESLSQHPVAWAMSATETMTQHWLRKG